MKNSGRSFSNVNPQGIRRKVGGKELAPRSCRRNGKRFITECKNYELEKADVV